MSNSSECPPKSHTLVPVGSAVQIVQAGDAFCHQHGVVVGVKGGGWYDVKLDVSGVVQKCGPILPSTAPPSHFIDRLAPSATFICSSKTSITHIHLSNCEQLAPIHISQPQFIAALLPI